jgi:hypothetical protein
MTLKTSFVKPQLGFINFVLAQNQYNLKGIFRKPIYFEYKNILNIGPISIKQDLMEKAVSDNWVNTIGYGGSRPISPNDTEDDKSKNRRVEIKIISQ